MQERDARGELWSGGDAGRFRSFPFAGIILIRWLRVVPSGLSDVSNTPNEPPPSYRMAGTLSNPIGPAGPPPEADLTEAGALEDEVSTSLAQLTDRLVSAHRNGGELLP